MSGIPHPGLLIKLPTEWVRLRDYAAAKRVRYGTVKRWAHEGMPVLRSPLYDASHPMVRVLPVLADAWIQRHRAGTIAHNRTSVVYFARRLSDGAIKIGFTSDVERRVRELRKEYHARHELLASRPGDKPDELALHAKFADARIGLEWFRPTPEVMAEVNAAVELERRAAATPVRTNQGAPGDARVRGVLSRRRGKDSSRKA